MQQSLQKAWVLDGKQLSLCNRPHFMWQENVTLNIRPSFCLLGGGTRMIILLASHYITKVQGFHYWYLQALSTKLFFFTIWVSRLRYSWISSSNFVLLSTKSWSSFALLSRDLFSQIRASNFVTNCWNAFSNTESLSWTGFLMLGWIPWMMCGGKHSRICSRLESLCNQVKALAADFWSVWICWQTNVKKRTTNASICTEREKHKPLSHELRNITGDIFAELLFYIKSYNT